MPTSFSAQASMGLSSSNFDLEQNILGGDSREGLDEAATQEVLDIMRNEGVEYVLPARKLITILFLMTVFITFNSFDEARLRRHHRILARHGIDPSGTYFYYIFCVWAVVHNGITFQIRHAARRQSCHPIMKQQASQLNNQGLFSPLRGSI